MNDRMARGIFPILRQGLIDRERIATPRPPAMDKVQAELKCKLQLCDRPAGDYLGARYALACWLDEIFLADDSPRTQWWNEHKLETYFFQSNDRGWKFWVQARLAMDREDQDTAWVYYLAMLLGFRGEPKDTAALTEWRDDFEKAIGLKQETEWPDMPDEQPLSTGDRSRPMVQEELGRLIFLITVVVCPILLFVCYLVVSIGRMGGK